MIQSLRSRQQGKGVHGKTRRVTCSQIKNIRLKWGLFYSFYRSTVGSPYNKGTALNSKIMILQCIIPMAYFYAIAKATRSGVSFEWYGKL